jgi:hypothetical protein
MGKFSAWLAVLASVAVIVGAVVAVLTYARGGTLSSGASVSGSTAVIPSKGSSSATDGSSNPPQTAELSSPTLTWPTERYEASRSQGFVASGAVPAALWPDTIWILDHGSEYIVDTVATIRSGKWYAPDGPLGDSSNSLPYKLTMVAVLANPDCASRLSALDKTVAGDHTPHLPPGCRQFGQVTVTVSKP